jgi:hypothetical protein
MEAIAPNEWKIERILILVKTYPQPSRKHQEVVCTAGLREDGSFVRLFPINFRALDEKKRFERYRWIKAPIRKASDPRPESYNIDIDNLEMGERIGTDHNWAKRKDMLAPNISPSIEHLEFCQREVGTSLGIIRPSLITDFYLKPTKESDWSPAERAKLDQMGLLTGATRWLLEKIPIEFRYRFVCDDPECQGHDMGCLDWEIAEAYRSWRRRYPDPVLFEQKLLQRFRHDMMVRNDTHFFVGTLARFPKTWTIVGLFYPAKEA